MNATSAGPVELHLERLKADANLSGEIEAVPPEGALLPETFMVERGTSRQAIVDRAGLPAKALLVGAQEAARDADRRSGHGGGEVG